MKKTEIKIEDYSKDQTIALREALESDHIIFPENKEILAEGMIEGEPYNSKFKYFNYGVMRLHERENVAIIGNNSTVYSKDAAVPYPQKGVDFSSFRANLKVYKSKNVYVENLNLNGGNKNSEYHHVVEFEHGIHLEECKNVLLDNINVDGSFGCGIYVGGKYNQENVYIINPTLINTGRMGISVSHVENLYVKNLVAVTARGPFDVEPPTDKYFNKNIILDGGDIRSNGGFYAFPIGGNGTVENLLIQNVKYSTSGGTAYVRGGKGQSVRESIIFSGNYSPDNDFGSSKGAYVLKAKNVLIENEQRKLDAGRSRVAVAINPDCENVHIRNNDWENAEFIKVYEDFDLSRLKVYGNKQKLKAQVYSYDRIPPSEIKAGRMYEIRNGRGFDFTSIGSVSNSDNVIFTATKDGYLSENNKGDVTEIVDVVELNYTPTEEEKNTIPFDVPEFILSAYENRFIVPDKGEIVEFLKPEPTPEPETPVEQPEKSKEWHENKLLWVVGVIVLVIILALIL